MMPTIYETEPEIMEILIMRNGKLFPSNSVVH